MSDNDTGLLRGALETCRLGLRAAYHACECEPGFTHAYGARRGCGACRAIIALEAVIPQLKAALKELSLLTSD